MCFLLIAPTPSCASAQRQILIWRRAGLLYDSVQRDQVLTVKAKQHARRPFRRQVCPDFPEAASHRAAQRHSYRLPPLRSQQVLAYRLPFFFWQLPQPFPYRLASG